MSVATNQCKIQKTENLVIIFSSKFLSWLLVLEQRPYVTNNMYTTPTLLLRIILFYVFFMYLFVYPLILCISSFINIRTPANLVQNAVIDQAVKETIN